MFYRYQIFSITDTNFMKQNLFTKFLLCGFTGWCLECFWTGLGSLCKKEKNPKLTCQTSLWMFPIYGMAALIHPLSKKLKSQCAFVRGGVYSILIVTTEFLTGEILKKFRACPWDYSKSRFNVDGVIRFDYIPVWFFVGLFYEKLLDDNKTRTLL